MKNLNFKIYDEVSFPYDEFFTAQGFISKINKDGSVKVNLSYLHNYKQPVAKEYCLEFPRNITRIVNKANLTFLSGEE